MTKDSSSATLVRAMYNGNALLRKYQIGIGSPDRSSIPRCNGSEIDPGKNCWRQIEVSGEVLSSVIFQIKVIVYRYCSKCDWNMNDVATRALGKLLIGQGGICGTKVHIVGKQLANAKATPFGIITYIGATLGLGIPIWGKHLREKGVIKS